MTKLTFGISASSFVTVMVMGQNVIDHEMSYSQATRAMLESFYVDDGLTEADSVEEETEHSNNM